METNFPKLEERVLRRWREAEAFKKSVERRKKGPRFVFYDGPPTANAGPGIHHMLNRVYKDVVLRYKTMRGFYAPRKAGWDTHGLPVELQIEKALGLKTKKDIEKYGIAKFNKKCRDSVWKYKGEWEKFNERVGLWIDMDHPYVTYETRYVESLWWIVKRFWEKDLLYRGHKVVPYCPRCGTPLSSHELAQGYKTVTDRSVTAQFRVKGKPNTSLLAWTTTPWTLPGNVALAVGEKIQYVYVKQGAGTYILAKNLLEKLEGEYEVVREVSGKELEGLEYEPLFDVAELRSEKSHRVYLADFVSTETGTGIVHTAVMYGEDDYQLGEKFGLPKRHTVDEEGKFNELVPKWKGMLVKEADPFVIQDLQKRDLLFREENYEHEYPHCWRCSTPLLYYAKESWFLSMRKVKQKLLAANKSVHWIPSHIKEGRMGEWLAEVKDWAFSRERYWGTPLPVWQCGACKEVEVIGSVQELAEKLKSSNTYYLMRHGHSLRQVTNEMSSYPEPRPVPLTKKGIQQAKKAAKELQKEKIDLIFASDLRRAKETAEIIAKELGAQVVYDARLREFDTGTYNGKHVDELGKFFRREGETEQEHYLRRFSARVPKGENWTDVQLRLLSFLKDMEKKQKGKKILVVSHEVPLTLFEGISKGLDRKAIVSLRMGSAIRTGMWRKMKTSLFPYNSEMEIDLHRPYIDQASFPCALCKKGEMKRVSDVIDVWYDSGAMPFAQQHWPFEEKRKTGSVPPKEYPADYIVEAIDQTRGWFYTLLAVASLLGFKAPYKHSISLGHILDEQGQKMSKSKGNIVNPWNMMDSYGTDTLRWYFFTVNNPGDSKLFSEQEIVQAQRRFINTLWNSFVFYETYAHKELPRTAPRKLGALDAWIFSRLNTVAGEMTAAMDAYDITGAARTLENFVMNDLSLWYIRRSRQRFQNPASLEDFEIASHTLRSILLNVCTMAAPFIPFLAEHMFSEIMRKIRKGLKRSESVHWQDWIEYQKKRTNKELEAEMIVAREIVAKALAERAKAGIKVRQPLAKLVIGKKLPQEILALISEEVNVKNIEEDSSLREDVKLDTELTLELRQEGLVRELIRTIQDMRKRAGYKPRHKVFLSYSTQDSLAHLISHRTEEIMRAAGIREVKETPPAKTAFDAEQEFSLDGEKIWIGLKKSS
ncbi:MAG: class I tRNA ligase family protein [Candidatus Yanofskybacteria bacterium]|nr:class I tRNA ligase family protein [Candidatus Yanofskybacteria bacterium]